MAFTAKIIVMAFSPPEGCLLKRRPTEGGHVHPRTPSLRPCPLSPVSAPPPPPLILLHTLPFGFSETKVNL